MSLFKWMVVVFAMWLAAVPVAESSDPSDTLKAQGLRKVGSYWILPGEKELQRRLKALSPRERELKQALKLRADYDKYVANSRVRLQAAIAERRRLSLVLLQVDDRDDVAAVAQRINLVSNQIDGLVRYVNDPGPEAQIDQRIGAAADALYEELGAIRVVVDETQARYETLAGDAVTTEAIAALAEASGRKVTLGPRRVFARWIRDLDRYESAVQTEEIALRKRGGVFLVDTVINGKTHVAMVFDTGASLVSLSAEVARRAGLMPSDDDPVIRLQVADGRVVEGRLMFLAELRVGGFTASNVECAVLPPSMDNVKPLLGGSFLRHFSIKMNHAAATLTLTKVAAPE